MLAVNLNTRAVAALSRVYHLLFLDLFHIACSSNSCRWACRAREIRSCGSPTANLNYQGHHVRAQLFGFVRIVFNNPTLHCPTRIAAPEFDGCPPHQSIRVKLLLWRHLRT